MLQCKWLFCQAVGSLIFRSLSFLLQSIDISPFIVDFFVLYHFVCLLIYYLCVILPIGKEVYNMDFTLFLNQNGIKYKIDRNGKIIDEIKGLPNTESSSSIILSAISSCKSLFSTTRIVLA